MTFKREGFLKFVYFTDQENRDPQAADDASARARRAADQLRRPLPHGAPRTRAASRSSSPTGDAINGPLHTNDENLLICGSPIFGREKTKDGATAKTDAIEVSGPAPGYQRHNSGCADTPQIFTPTQQVHARASKQLELPPDNQELATVADNGGRSTPARRSSASRGTVMDVTNYAASGTPTTTLNVPWPGNGVLYVKNNGACNGEIPTDADYDEPVGCGNVYVSGDVLQAAHDRRRQRRDRPPDRQARSCSTSSTDCDIKLVDGSDATLGLIANNFVRVGHKVIRSGSSCVGNYNSTDEPTITNVRIDAAIMSLLHSFMVDNYNCGKAGTLTVNGAIVQKYRGPVGTGSGALDHHRLPEGLLVRRPPALPLAAVLPGPARGRLGSRRAPRSRSPRASATNLQAAYPPVLAHEDQRIAAR